MKLDHTGTVGHNGLGLHIQIPQKLVIIVIERTTLFRVFEQFLVVVEIGQHLPFKLLLLASNTALHHFLADNEVQAVGIGIVVIKHFFFIKQAVVYPLFQRNFVELLDIATVSEILLFRQMLFAQFVEIVQDLMIVELQHGVKEGEVLALVQFL